MNNSTGIVALLIVAIVVITIINTMSYLLVKNESIRAHDNLEKLITPDSIIDRIHISNISPLFKSDPYYFKDFTSAIKLEQFKESIKEDRHFEVYFSNPSKYKQQCDEIIEKYLDRYALLISECIHIEYMIKTISKITDIPFSTLVKDMSLSSSDGIHIDPPPLIYSHFSQEVIAKIIDKYEKELNHVKHKNL